VKVALRGNDQKLVELVGSAKAAKAVLSLTGSQAGKFRESLAELEHGTEKLGAAFDAKGNTIAAQRQRMANAMESISISIGRILAPAIERIVPLIDRLADAWESLSPATQQAAVVMGAIAAALGPATIAFSGFASVFGAGAKVVGSLAGWTKYLWMMRASIMAGLIPSLTAAIASVWAFTVALLANPITWIVGGIVALAGAAYLVVKYWEPIKKFFVDLWDGIVAAFSKAWETIQPIVDGVKKAFEYSPIGLAVKAGGAIGNALFGADDARPTLGADRAAPAVGRSSETRVVVDFNNAPKGTRATEAPGGTAPLDLSMGYSMLGAT
jgi:phage-related minor tail protein